MRNSQGQAPTPEPRIPDDWREILLASDTLGEVLAEWMVDPTRPIELIIQERNIHASTMVATDLEEIVSPPQTTPQANSEPRKLPDSSEENFPTLADHAEGPAHLLDHALLISTEFTETAPTAPGGGAILANTAGITLDTYQIESIIAEGGLGVVFTARDRALNRQVALKRIRPHLAAKPASRDRFQVEAEITGCLEHPGIVPVYSLGADAHGNPYYSMRLIRGETFLVAVDRLHQNSPIHYQGREFRHLIRRFLAVCDAISYAHSQGILHRDLKPSNIMLGPFGETLVVDWGLAKRLGSTEAERDSEPELPGPTSSGSNPTAQGTTLGTPRYMSPEQARGQVDRLGVASDVYSLGATLYHLLVGKAPLEEVEAVPQILALTAAGRILSPRMRNRRIPGPLDAICRKAMAHRVEDRYTSVRLLARDLESWLTDEPIEGIREGLASRATRLARRHRRSLVIVAGVSVLIAITALFAAFKVNDARQTSQALLAKLAFDEGISLSLNEESPVGLHWLIKSLELKTPSTEFDRVVRTNLASWGAATHGLRHALPMNGPVKTIQVHPTQPIAVALGLGSSVWVWDIESGRLLDRLELNQTVLHAQFTRDGSRILTASGSEIRFWSLQTRQPVGPILEHPQPIDCLAMSPDGKRVLSVAGREARLWDVDSGQQVHSAWSLDTDIVETLFSPNGQRVLLRADGETVQVRQTDDGMLLGTLSHPTTVYAMQFSPQGDRIATSAGVVGYLWDAQSLQPIAKQAVHTAPIEQLAFSPGTGEYLATGGADTLIGLWNGRDGGKIRADLDHRGAIRAVEFSADTRFMASASDDSLVQLWSLPRGRTYGAPLTHPAPVSVARFTPDGQFVLTGANDGVLRVWRIAHGALVSTPLEHEHQIRAQAFHPAGRMLATATEDGSIQLWDIRTGQQVARRVGGQESDVTNLAFVQNGRVLLSAGPNGKIHRWSIPTLELVGEPVHHPGKDGGVRRLSVSNDGRLFATVDFGGLVQVWNAALGIPLIEPLKVRGRVLAMVFHPDNRRLAVAIRPFDTVAEGEVRLYDAMTGQEVAGPFLHDGFIRDIAISPDGHLLATGSADQTARIWDLRTGKPRTEPLPHRGTIWSVRFSPDNQLLLTASLEGVARLWSTDDGLAWGNPMQQDDLILSAEFSPNGRTIVTSGRDNQARLWDTATTLSLGAPMSHDDIIRSALFSPDGDTIATMGVDQVVKLWRRPAPRMGQHDELRLWVDVLTSVSADEPGRPLPMNYETWVQRKAEWKAARQQLR